CYPANQQEEVGKSKNLCGAIRQDGPSKETTWAHQISHSLELKVFAIPSFSAAANEALHIKLAIKAMLRVVWHTSINHW
ncbi:hypothetical protein RRG08_027354, partial [Elysia crispata]